jgi:hypothetical protein
MTRAAIAPSDAHRAAYFTHKPFASVDPRYAARRAQIDGAFEDASRLDEPTVRDVSPSAHYALDISRYTTSPDTWNYSRGVVTRVADGFVIADVRRNYAHFWHQWVTHPNGSTYLLCGEDYQGYTLINLDRRITHTCFPDAAYDGRGFCWTAAHPSPDGLLLAVEGCYWACPSELVLYDFRTPDQLPLTELERVGMLLDAIGWDGTEFVATIEEEDDADDAATTAARESLRREVRLSHAFL